MKYPLRFLGAVLLAALVGCTTTTFQPYETRSNVFTGNGGTKTVVDGIDFWENGDPPRKFKILGVIDDDRPRGWIVEMSLTGDIVAKAIAAGGDAVILAASDSYVNGYYTNGSATSYGSAMYGNATTTAVRRKVSKYIVVKYLD